MVAMLTRNLDTSTATMVGNWISPSLEGPTPLAYLSRLTLTNFRNFVQLDLDLSSGVVVFFGANAQGKTTLLEAIYLLAISRSFRADNEREVVNFEAGLAGEQALVGGAVVKGSERLAVYVGYQCVAARSGAPRVAIDDEHDVDNPKESAPPARTGSGGGLGYSVRKEIRVSRVRRTAAELVGMVGAVLFSADDIDLVYGPPSGRRKYLDILISQSDPVYIKTLQRYQRVVQQRNQLLRMLRDGRAEGLELDFWDGELVREGAWLTWQRHQTMERLSGMCAEHHGELSGSEAQFQMQYRPSVLLGPDLEATVENFKEALDGFRARELATAATVSGPHRDDFMLWVNRVDMGTFASRGEARTLALTLRLAEASYLASVRGDEPIVLLDDVLSEMDASRRERVLGKISQYQQTLITTTDLDLVRAHFGADAAYYRVANGGVSPLTYQDDGTA